MEQSIINRIEELNYNTSDNINSIQNLTIPHLIEDEDTRLVLQSTYRYDGRFYSIPYTQKITIINIYPLPVTSNINNNQIFIETMSNALKKGYIRPFALFLEGKFIKWSDITIVKDHSYSYLLISGVEYEAIKSYAILDIPYGVSYSEGNKVLTRTYNTNCGLYFSIDGLMTDSYNAYSKIEFKSDKIAYNEFDAGDIITIPSYNGQLTNIKNILPFLNGEFRPDIRDSIENLGLGLFKPNTELYQNAKYLVFYNLNSNPSKDLLYKVLNRDKLKEYLINGTNSEYLNTLKENFEFEFEYDKDYETNLSDALNYIMKYDSSLMNKVYKDRSLIETVEYTGKEILSMIRDNKLTMNRRLFKGLPCYVMIFKNNRLYEKFNTLRYDGTHFTVLMDEIEEDDKLEFLFFKYIKNNNSSIKVTKNSPLLTSAYYDLENCSLFSIEIENSKFPVSEADLVDFSTIKYEVPFQCTPTTNKYEYNITLDNEFYYDRKLYLSHNRQFRYCYYNINTDCLGVTLSSDFRFCHNIDKYMVFINGLLIPKENIVLNIMDGENPFDELSIYTNITMHEGDLIEIFYLPLEITNVITTPNTIPETGDIMLDGSNLEYNLSKDLYLFFINGAKIHTCDIDDIGKNQVKLKSDIGSISNLQVIKHIEKIDDLYILFKLEDDKWNTFIDSLPLEIFDELFNTDETLISNTRELVANASIPMRKLIFEIYKNFYSDSGSDEIDYYYTEDNSLLGNNDVDKNGNYIIRSSDAANNDKATLDRSNTNNGEEDKSAYE